jgi:hypothetical protein
MASDHQIRASDQDRDAVVTTLRDAYTAGRLTLEEFDERMTAAYASRTWGELRKLTDDLPAQPILGADVPGRTVAAPELPAPELPAQAPRLTEVMPPLGQQRRRGGPPFVPLVALWIVLAFAAEAPNTFVPALILIMVVLFLAFARRSRRR